jgi:hypothetical protein
MKVATPYHTVMTKCNYHTKCSVAKQSKFLSSNCQHLLVAWIEAAPRYPLPGQAEDHKAASGHPEFKCFNIISLFKVFEL